MVIWLAAVMLAEVTIGLWPSSSAIVESANSLPASSVRDAGTTVRVPAASVPTALPPIVTSWESAGAALAGPVSVRDPPPDASASDEYADAPGATGSV